MRCTKCGNKLKSKWNYCPRCGLIRGRRLPFWEGAGMVGILFLMVLVICLLFGKGSQAAGPEKTSTETPHAAEAAETEPAGIPAMHGGGVPAAMLAPINSAIDFIMTEDVNDALRALPPEFTENVLSLPESVEWLIGKRVYEYLLTGVLTQARGRLGSFDEISYEVIGSKAIENEELLMLFRELKALKMKDLPKKVQEVELAIYAENGSTIKEYSIKTRLLLIGDNWYIDPDDLIKLLSNEQ